MFLSGESNEVAQDATLSLLVRVRYAYFWGTLVHDALDRSATAGATPPSPSTRNEIK